MGNIVGNQFGLVASKNQKTAITDSKAAGNEAKFYITKNDSNNTGATCNAVGNAEDGIALTINGNVLRGMSKKQEETVNKYIDVNPATVYKFKGTVADYTALTKITSVKAGDVYNVTDPTSAGYPKETNFAATKDGTGATSGIWDPLGGIMVSVSTADNITVSTYPAEAGYQTLTMKSYADTRDRTAVDAIEIAAAKPITISSRTPNGDSVPTLGLNLGTGLLVDNTNKLVVGAENLVKGNLLSYAPHTQIINGTSVSFQTFPISINENVLNEGVNSRIQSLAVLRTEVSTNASNTAIILDRGLLTIQIPKYTDNPEQVDGLLCIATNQAKSSANGLYISSTKLKEFVNNLINIAISSYLNAK